MQHPEPHDQRVANLIAAFETMFGRRPEGIAQAPGRVNLIGEHVDYNDGLVLPVAIDRTVMCTWVRADPALQEQVTPPQSLYRQLEGDVPSTLVEFFAVDRERSRLFGSNSTWRDAHLVDQTREGDFTDYPHGILWALVNQGWEQQAFQCAFSGDVPEGAGLSSSAALEVSIAGALRHAFALPIDNVTLAKLCQRAENEYVGVQCGVMDQFASALSKRDHALLIDCRTLAYERIPLRLEEAGLAVVIVNSAVKRELVSSAYNDRRRECEEAVAILRDRLGRPDLTSLRDVTAADLGRIEIDIVPMRRARHAVTEIARVAACVAALRTDDFTAVGELMLQSHISLRDDYDVSSSQLDLLVALATAQDYVLGARLTGAGFGGCTVNLVRADAIDTFERDVVDAYRQRANLPAEAWVTTPQDGLHTWSL